MAKSARPPLHIQIRDDILSRIGSGALQVGARLETEFELAQRYGASRTTVRQALSSLAASGYVERTRKRGTFVSASPSVAAPGAWVAMIVIDLFGYVVRRCSAGVATALAKRGVGLRLYSNNNSPALTEQAIAQAVREGAAGVVLYAAEDTCYSAAAHALKRRGFPLCLVDRPLSRLATDCAMSDHAEGGFSVTAHLIAEGHTQIGFVSSVSPTLTYPVAARLDGYRAALEQAGVVARDEWVVTGHAEDLSWTEALRELLSQAERPSAIFASNDSVAAVAFQTAYALGLSVPRDLALVGFDNTEIVSRLAVPLTTVEQPFEEIGTAAARLLMERMEGRRTELAWAILPTQLVVRESSLRYAAPSPGAEAAEVARPSP